MNYEYQIKFSLSILLIEKHDHILLNAFVRQRLFSVTGKYVLLYAALVVKFTQELYKTLVSQTLLGGKFLLLSLSGDVGRLVQFVQQCRALPHYVNIGWRGQK